MESPFQKMATHFSNKRSELPFYQHFEQAVGLILALFLSVLIIFSLFHLAVGLYQVVTSGINGYDYADFQAVFERLLIVLIALEFNHSLQQLATGKRNLIQVQTVVLIGILVIVRKFILIDLETTSAMYIFGLAAAILALGAAYWMVLDRETRDDEILERRRAEEAP